MSGHAYSLSIVLLGAMAGCSAPTSSSVPPIPTAATGARLYESNCAACHQLDARGVPGVYPSLVGSPVLLGDAVDLSRWVIQGQRPASLPAGKYPTVMARFGWLKPGDAAALFSYVRTNFGNAAPAIEANVVAHAIEAAP